MWLKVIVRAWAAPYSVLGLLLGLAVIVLGGHARRRHGALEFCGGRLGLQARRLRIPFVAITLGHVIVGLDGATLDAARLHEQVHVRQYERWGPFFGPAYLLSSLVQLVRGGRPYWDNRFEREAFAKAAGASRG